MSGAQMNDVDDDWVRIESSDGFGFVLRRSIANISGTIKSSLDIDSGFAEANAKTYHSEQRGAIVQKLIEYMCFKAHYQHSTKKEEVPVNELIERIPPEIVLELLLAADYLEM